MPEINNGEQRSERLDNIFEQERIDDIVNQVIVVYDYLPLPKPAKIDNAPATGLSDIISKRAKIFDRIMVKNQVTEEERIRIDRELNKRRRQKKSEKKENNQ